MRERIMYRKLGSLLVLCLFVFIIYYLNIQDDFFNEKNQKKAFSNSKLLFAVRQNKLPFFGFHRIPPNQGIFFLETSRREFLYSRELCALESAAKNNPSRPIYYLLSNIDFLEQGALDFLKSRYSNINTLKMDLTAFFLGTPFEDLWLQNVIQRSKYQVSHLSDVMRFLILSRFGGTYLDSDLIVLRNLPTHFNYAGVEHIADPFDIAVGILHFSQNHPIINYCVEYLSKHFDTNNWGNNGPKLFTSSIMQHCKAYTMDSINEAKCLELTLLPPKMVYSIYFENWKSFFDPTKNRMVEEELKESFIAHYWGKLSFGAPFKRNTTLFLLAKKHCPITAEHLLL